MPSSEYQRQYRLDNPDKYKIWDKRNRERRKFKMQTDSEYRERILASKRKSDKKRIEKMKSDPELLAKLREQRNRAIRKWYNQKAKLNRVLNNMKTIQIDKVEVSTPSTKPKSKPKPPTKEQAYKTMYLKVCNLEAVIHDPVIREPRINQLRNEFYQQYGVM